jgi:hypothetical protein
LNPCRLPAYGLHDRGIEEELQYLALTRDDGSRILSVNTEYFYLKDKEADMKKIFHLSVIVMTLTILVLAGNLWAGPVTPACPAHSQQCFERDGDFYCSWQEDVRTNTLVRGRAGLLQWVQMPSSELRTQKCAGGIPENLN